MIKMKMPFLSILVSSFGLVSCITKHSSEELELANFSNYIVADHNRNGTIDPEDAQNQGWNWRTGGAFMMAAITDANRNGLVDGAEKGPRTEAMLKQFVPLRINLQGPVQFTHTGGEHVLVYSQDGQKEIASSSQITGPTTLWIAAKYFAGMNQFTGYVDFKVVGSSNQAFKTTVRVAPWLMLPNSAVTKKLFIAEGFYRTAPLLKADLAKLTTVQSFPANRWELMWMQDTMEIGYQEVPGKAPQYAILQADRCKSGDECDPFALSLLSESIGVFRVKATPRKEYGMWDDWYGNLEVSAPTPQWPLGRIYYGINLNENLANVLKKQEVQSPFVIDPTWLEIKHVDEFLNFVSDSSGKAYITVASPRLAASLDGTTLDSLNQYIQKKIDHDLKVAMDATGVSANEIIELPVLYGEFGDNRWSSPINSVHMDRVVAVGNTGEKGPLSLKSSVYGPAIEAGFAKAGIKVVWVDDRAYQPNHGNVHCGTNTIKEPVAIQFWRLPLLTHK
jgi:protein-arginine deiminase